MVYLAIAFLMVIVALGMHFRKVEIEEFNNGTCRKCNSQYQSTHIDSQGGVGWKCSGCGNYLDTTWVKGVVE